MTRTTNCVFCKIGVEGLSSFSARYSRKVYEDDVCYAVLENEQSIIGYTLVILKEHKETILDNSITDEQLVGFWRAVHKIGNRLKTVLGAENVYVCSLCDGVSHFHVHLAPRYKWTTQDKERYSELFRERDGEQAVKLSTALGKIGGFWYLADTERDYSKTEFGRLSIDGKGKFLQDLADRLKKIYDNY